MNFKQIMIAQAGALGLVAGSHMAETDGDTFSKLNTKLQSGLIQGVYEQLAVKVSLPCPDFYASFPTKLANLHLKLGGLTGELDDDEKLNRSKCITRLAKWNENFEKDVDIQLDRLKKNMKFIVPPVIGRNSLEVSTRTNKRARLSAQALILKNRREKRNKKQVKLSGIGEQSGAAKRMRGHSDNMFLKYKRMKGQSMFYTA